MNSLFTFLGKSFKSDIGDTSMKYLNFFSKNNLCSTLCGFQSMVNMLFKENLKYLLSFEFNIVKTIVTGIWS
jgi:hypothetical protein